MESCYHFIEKANNVYFYPKNTVTSHHIANIDICPLENTNTACLFTFLLTVGSTANSVVEVAGGRSKRYGFSANSSTFKLTELSEEHWGNNGNSYLPDIELALTGNVIIVETTANVDSNIYLEQHLTTRVNNDRLESTFYRYRSASHMG
jgi:hypothetical protein